jgi:hypothetical protein
VDGHGISAAAGRWGKITAADTITPDIVIHPGPNETRFTTKGMTYRGQLVEDAGAAHAILLAVLNGHPVPPPAAANEGQEAREIARLTKLAAQNNADAEMYARAWQRELAGFLRPKGHHIDMLVVSTRDLAERCRTAESRVKELTAASADCGAPIAESGSLADKFDRARFDAMNLTAAHGTALPPLAFVIDQLEAADAPDTRLDCLIAIVVGCNQAPVPAYTASFDEALKLIEPGRDYELTSYGSGSDGATYTCAAMKWWPRPDDKKGWRSESGNKLSPALALCIAALKVKLARAEEGGGAVKRSAA